MTKIDTSTEAVEALLKDVTDGPWEIDGIGISHSSKPYGYPIDICLMGEPAQYAGDTPSMLEGWETNARFIAASRELVPALLAERDALKAALADARETAMREAADEAYDADSFELANYGGNKIAERILALIDKGESHE